MDVQALKTMIDEQNRLFGEFREELKRGAAADQAKLARMEERFAQIETKLSRPAFSSKTGGDEGLDPAETKKRHEIKKAVLHWCRKGTLPAAMPEEHKTLIVSDDTTGGLFAGSELDSEILKNIIELSDVRSIVRVRTTSKRSIRAIKRTGTFTAQWVAKEQTTKTETEGLKYGLEEIPNHELYAYVIVSNQDLEDAEFDLEGTIREEASEQFALAEGKSALAGDAKGEMEGLLTNPDVASDLSGAAGAISYDGFVDVSHNIKTAYFRNGRFIFNLKTLGGARKLKDDQGNPIWQPMTSSEPATILGKPYTLLPDMPDISATAYPVMFGDFKRAYTLVDRLQMEVLRDPYSSAKAGAVEFILRKRVGGQVVIAESVRKLKSNNS